MGTILGYCSLLVHIMNLRTFLRVSPPGALVSNFEIASLSPRTKSGGVRVFVLKKFMVGAKRGRGKEGFGVKRDGGMADRM